MSRKASGLKAWALQRGTAIYLILFFVYAVFKLMFAAPADYLAWQAWLGDPVVGVATLVFFAALLLHAWIGIRDVLIDYIKPTGIRVGLLGLVAVTLIGCGLWAAKVLILAANA